MTDRQSPYAAAKGGMAVGADPGSGFVRIDITIPDHGDAYEILFPVDRVDELIEDLERAARQARAPRPLRSVD